MEKEHSLLIIDNEHGIVDQLYDYFRKDFTVHKAYDGEEAVNIFNANEVHLVMTNQRMPKMQGTEILTKFKEKKPEVTRILMTGNTDLEVAIEAINKGSIHRYLQKPLDFDELTNIIKDGLQLYEQCTKAKNMIANEKDDIIGKIKNVFSQIKDVEDNKEKLEEELREAKEVENKVRSEMEVKIKELENDKAGSDNEISGLNSKMATMADDLDRTKKKVRDMEEKLSSATKIAQSVKDEMTSITQERDTALAEKTRVDKKLKQFQANWAKILQQG